MNTLIGDPSGITAEQDYGALNLEALTSLAQEQYEECLWAIERSLQKQLQFGRLLQVVKSRLPNGQWERWVQETFADHKSLRTIQRHMRGAKAIAKNPALLECADSLDGILKSVKAKKTSIDVVELPKAVSQEVSAIEESKATDLSLLDNSVLAESDQKDEPRAVPDMFSELKETIRGVIEKFPENQRAIRWNQLVAQLSEENGVAWGLQAETERAAVITAPAKRVLFPDAVEDMQAMERREQRDPSEDPFDVFYKIFPKKVNKLKARAAFNKARAKLLNKHGRSSIVESIIIEGAKVYAERANPEYLCLPTTWLNGDRWEDDPEAIWTGDRPKEKSGNATFGTYTDEERAQLQDAVF